MKSVESAEHPEKGNDSDFKTRCMEKMRKVPGLGLLFALGSGTCFATAGFSFELLEGLGEDGGKGVDASLVVVIRSVIQLIVFLPAALWFGEPIFGTAGERSYLLQRAATGFACFALSYYALNYISLADSSAIAFSAPVFVSIFACFILKEPCGAFQITTVVCTLVGVFMIARPSFIFGGSGGDLTFTVSERLIGTILSFLTCLTMAYAFVAMRQLQKTPTTTVVAFFSIFCIIIGTMTVLVIKYATTVSVRFPASSDIKFLILNGMCGVFGQLFLVMALKIEEAGLVSLTRTFDIVMAFIYQVTCLHQDAPILSIIGSIIVCCGCVACGLKKFFDARPDASEKLPSRIWRLKKICDVNAPVTLDAVNRH